MSSFAPSIATQECQAPLRLPTIPTGLSANVTFTMVINSIQPQMPQAVTGELLMLLVTEVG